MAPTRRLTVDLDVAQVRPLLEGLGEPASVSRLHGGSTEVYRIDLAAGADPLVLKIYPDDPAWAPAKEALVAGWVGDRLSVPVPTWLKLDETRTRLPLRYAVTTWLPGRTLRSLIGETGLAGAYRRMGELLHTIHAIPMTAYGYIVGDGVHQPQPTNQAYMALAFEDVFRRFRAAGGDADLARKLERALQSRWASLAHCDRPVLCHDDFQQGNLLAERDKDGELRLTGLIDFGNARAADPLFDVARALACMAHEDPASGAPFLAGYGPIDHPALDEALWCYTLFHQVIMWAWLTGFGDDPAQGPAGLLRDLGTMVE